MVDVPVAALGVVIVHFHREAEVARLVRDLVRRDGVPDVHVVVVDNGSTDDQLAVQLQSYGVSPVVIRRDNVGYAAGMNVGVAALPATVGTLLLLTHEVDLAPGAIDELLRHLAASPASVAGPVLLTSPTRVWSAGGVLPGVRSLPAHRLHGADVSALPTTVEPCDWLDGSVVAMRCPTWDELGGLDERFFLYAEDVDLGLRARAAGHPVEVVPGATATQSPSGDIDPYLWTRNTFLLFRRHGRVLAWLLWLASCLTGILRDLVRPRSAQVPRRLRAISHGVRSRGGSPPAKHPTRGGIPHA